MLIQARCGCVELHGWEESKIRIDARGMVCLKAVAVGISHLTAALILFPRTPNSWWSSSSDLIVWGLPEVQDS